VILFFFQAEDGIRDRNVTGVQTCALPIYDMTWTPLYLNSKTSAENPAKQDNGTLQFTPDDTTGCVSYEYDPNHPAPQLIDMSENEVGVPADYQQVEMRDDVLVYSTSPLQDPVTVVGDIYATLYAASTAKDTDWIIRVTDVAPDDTSTKLVDGVLRARYRNGYEQEVLLELDRIEAYNIRTSKLGHTFKKGHRIRLTITSSANHFIFPNANTGNDPASDTQTQTATQTIYHTPE